MDEEKMKFIGKALKKAGELLDDEPSEQTLLNEYSACQQDVDNLNSQFWPSVTVTTGINVIFLTGLVHGTITGTRTLHDVIWWIVGGLVISMFTSLWLCLHFKRKTYLNQICLHRMREIENILGMWKNRTVDYIDNSDNSKQKKYKNEPDRLWSHLSVQERSRLDKIKNRYYPKKIIACLTGSPLKNIWLIVINFSWVILLIFAYIDP